MIKSYDNAAHAAAARGKYLRARTRRSIFPGHVRWEHETSLLGQTTKTREQGDLAKNDSMRVLETQTVTLRIRGLFGDHLFARNPRITLPLWIISVLTFTDYHCNIIGDQSVYALREYFILRRRVRQGEVS